MKICEWLLRMVQIELARFVNIKYSNVNSIIDKFYYFTDNKGRQHFDINARIVFYSNCKSSFNLMSSSLIS